MTTVGDAVALPGDPAYAEAAGVFNLSAPAEPAAAVTVRTVGEIRAAIGHAVARGLPVRVHTTGHGSAAARPMPGALLIRTLLDGDVEIDVERRVARIPAGTRWGAVVAKTSRHGLVPPHGSSPDVGVVGYLLRGGMSFYGRKVGVATGSVRAVELVTADGELRRADAAHDPELLWALRGGGGGFGVVTAVEVDLFPVTQTVTGAAFWPAAHADRLLRIWRAWTADAPDEASTSARIMRLPALPDVPPPLAAGPVLCVDGVVLIEDDVQAGERMADDLLAPLRAVAEPVIDTWGLTGAAGVLDAHMDPSDPVEIIGDHLLLNEIGEDGVSALLDVIGPDSGAPLITSGLRQLGGAFARPAGDGVLTHFDARYAYSGAGVPGLLRPGITADDIRAHCAKVRAALAPWDTGRTAPTFVERIDQPQRHLTPEQVAAVDRVRARVDPSGLFRGDISPSCTELY